MTTHSPHPVRLVIADDHPMVLRGIVDFLTENKNFTVVASCVNGAECLNTIRDLAPDIAIVDISMPKMDGLQILAAIMAEKLSTRIVFLAGSPNDHEIAAAVIGGAYGLVLKEAAPADLMNCLHEVAAGRRWLASAHIDAALKREEENNKQSEFINRMLSRREKEVMLLIADGLSNKQIANQLRITEGTIKLHLHSIYIKLGITNRAALAMMVAKYLHKAQLVSKPDRKLEQLAESRK